MKMTEKIKTKSGIEIIFDKLTNKKTLIRYSCNIQLPNFYFFEHFCVEASECSG